MGMTKNGPEKPIERYLVQQIRYLGGTAYKFTSPGKRSVPDRVCVLPHGYVLFIECKAPGEIPTPEQERELKRLKDLGQWAYWVDTKGRIDTLVKFWRLRLAEWDEDA